LSKVKNSVRESLRAFWLHALGMTPRWIRILGCAGYDFVIDNGLYWSAAVAFYGLLSLFPLALAGIAAAGWFTDPHWAVEKASQMLGAVMPRGDSIDDIINKSNAARFHTGFFSLAVLVVAGSRVFGALVRALNIACDADEIYRFSHRLLVELGMLLCVGLLFLAALVSGVLFPILVHLLPWLAHARALGAALVSWVVPAVLLLGGFFCLYKFVPRWRCNWQSVLIAAAAATAGSLGARPLFLTYIGRLDSYKHVYGWLAIGIVFLVWLQIVVIITLYCAELASHIQMIVYDGLSGEEVRRRHRARSPGRSRDRERPSS
jgi:membrane protein